MEEGGIGGGISPEQAAAIAANTTKIDAMLLEKRLYLSIKQTLRIHS